MQVQTIVVIYILPQEDMALAVWANQKRNEWEKEVFSLSHSIFPMNKKRIFIILLYNNG
jgi:hypothetical protein